MNSLSDICRNLLDNADVRFLADAFPYGVVLQFHVSGTHELVNFECVEIVKLDLQMPPMRSEWYLVLETNAVQRPKNELKARFSDPVMTDFEDLGEWLWQIQICAGELILEVICEKFEWKVQSPDDKCILCTPQIDSSASATS